MKHQLPKRILFATYWWLEDLMRAVAHQAAERGWRLDFQMCLSTKLPDKWAGDGIITTLSGDVSEMAEFLDRLGLPAVSLNLNHPEIRMPRVVSDMMQVGHLGARHFLEREFRSFAFYSSADWETSKLACSGFRDAVIDAGHAFYPLIWPAEQGTLPDTWQNRHHWLCDRLRSLPKPLAVLAVDTLSPVEVIEAAVASGLSIPDDVAVLGYHDTALFRECTTLGLSSIVHDYDKQARSACDLLNQLMAGMSPSEEPLLISPAGLVVRESSDTIAARHPKVKKAIRYMMDHYAMTLDGSQLASLCGLSRAGLYKAFKNDVNQAPHEILTRIRLDKARKMLRETDEKVRTVAETCGFSDRANLHRHFKCRFDITPAAYRKKTMDKGLDS